MAEEPFDPEGTGLLQGDPDVIAQLQPKSRVASQEDYDKVAHGASYLDPEGKQRFKPIRNRQDWLAVAEGAEYADPEGQIRTKPVYQGIDFTAQTLYDMGVNDKERRKALERSYPGKVQEDPNGGFFVEDEGTLRKPGRGVAKVTGAVASSAAPTILSVLGALGGGAAGTVGGATAGSVVPVAGTIAGGISGGTAGVAAGGAGGAFLGQGFNDLIMILSGTYDRSIPEEAGNMFLAGAGGMMGAGVGRGVATAVPSLKSGVSALSAAVPGALRSVLGAGEQDLKMAAGLAEKGVAVPPSAWAKEAPHLQNVVEVFDPAFHTNQPLLESATAHYEKSAGALLNALGIKDPGSLTKPITDVPVKEAGEAVMRRTLGELAESDAKLQAALDAKKATAGLVAPAQEAQRETVLKAAEEARNAAQKLIDAGYKDIESDIKTGMKVAAAGHNSGDLWGAVGNKLVAVRRAVGERATVMYDAADQAAGSHLPNIEGLPHQAEQFLEQLPADFQNRYPSIVKNLRDLAGVKDPKTGEWIKEPVSPTFGQLHNMRSQMRANINYSDLTPDIREGAYKFFAGKVDQILHGINEPPALTIAAAAAKYKGKTYTGAIHPDAVVKIADELGIDVSNDAKFSQFYTEQYPNISEGFVTNTGEFVSRTRAARIVEESGQYKAGVKRETKLDALEANMSGPEKSSSRFKPLEFEPTVFGQRESSPAIAASRSRGRQEALQEASKLLKQADAFYAENIKLFNANQVKAVMRGLESGEPADPQALYNVVVKSGQTDLTNAIKEKVGPNLWAGVKAADMTAMLDVSKTLVPDVVDGKAFARQVLDRVRNGTLEVVHGKEASAKLIEQAQRIEMLEGRLPIPVRAGDTVTQVLARARQAEELAKAEAKRDPLATLSKEMRKIEIEGKREAAKLAAERRKDPLGFLYNPTTGAAEAVDKILGSEDLILAAAAKFGEQSPEFDMLRQVWAQRLLTGGLRPGQELAKVSPEVQQIMFPGVTLGQARTLAKEMDFLLDTRSGSRGTAQGMAAMAKVEHPWGTLGQSKSFGGAALKGVFGSIPGSSAAARSALGSYYATMRKLATSPALLRYLERGLSGSPADREAVRQSIAAVLQKGGAVGAGAGEAAVQGSGPQ